jgi:microcin C transport system substrate-binding protein
MLNRNRTTGGIRAMAARLTAHAALALALVVSAGSSLPAWSQEPAPKRHAISLLGEPAYPPDFKHFGWVNPTAPKGGTVRLWSEGTFDNLNPFTLSGVAAAELDSTYSPLMVSSADELNVLYGLVAAWVSYPDDYSSVTFGLRPEARFHDGRPITPEDVIFTMEALKKANIRYAQFYKDVVRGEKLGSHEVRFHFSVTGNKKLPQQVAGMDVLPRHYWEGRDLSKTTLDIPLGSGPYRIRDVDRGRAITYERVADWWAKDLPVNRGQYNFDVVRIDYFRERTAAFESFKAGQIDYWYENTAKAWATDYEFPAVKNGLVKLARLGHKRPTPMQAFLLNQRRPQFKDIRVREALNLAFNFEEMNEQLLYSAYIRTSSYFDNSDFKPTGLPQGRELELLQEARKLDPQGVPQNVFTAEFKQPVGGPQSVHRRNLAQAARLLKEAGYTVSGTQLRNAAGQPLRIEILLNSPSFERHTQNYSADLRKLGIETSIRVVDSAQYQHRVRSFDYDVIVGVIAQQSAPGNEQRLYWSSEFADREGSMNTMGIKSKAVDLLVERIVFAKDKEELAPAVRALDRVLIWNHYLVAQWYYPYDRMAYWDRFGRPERMPSLTPAFDRVWWHDEERAKALAARRAQ